MSSSGPISSASPLPSPSYLALTTDSESTLGPDSPSEPPVYSSRQLGLVAVPNGRPELSLSTAPPPSPRRTLTPTRSSPTDGPLYDVDGFQVKDFMYETSRKGRQFIVLTLSAEERLSKTLATFVEGNPLTGRLALHFEKPDSINGVRLAIRGRLTYGISKTEQTTFLHIVKTLWTPHMGEPQHFNNVDTDEPPSPQRFNPSPTKQQTQFQRGTYEWKFAVKLPRDITLSVQGNGYVKEQRVFSLPEPFMERHARATIGYEITAEVERSGLWSSTHKCVAPFGFIPVSRPPHSFSPMRGMAYRDNGPLIGPLVDRDGWEALPPVTVRGKFFGNKHVQLLCALYLAKPLSYTRGSVIPIVLRLEGSDSKALDLLCSPNAIMVRLRRRVSWHSNDTNPPDSVVSNKDAVEDSGLASWWRSEEDDVLARGQERFLRGELALKPSLKPSTVLGGFSIKYEVVLLSFDISGFESGNSDTLLEWPVEIVTSYLPGPRPRETRPPVYEEARLSPGSRQSMYIGATHVA